MTDRPAVYTAIYGHHDRLIDPAPQDIEVDWYCFTDDPNLSSDTWRIVHQDPRHDDSRLAAKWPKMLPLAVLPDHRWTLWVDAHLAIDSSSFVREALGYAPEGLAVFRHPFRYCIYHEAFACLRREDCRRLAVVEQVENYRAEGYPKRNGLYACGVLVRDAEQAAARELGDPWLEECIRWSGRDQLSFPVVLKRLGIEPAVFPFHIGRSPAWLSAARYLGLTPGTFPVHLLKDPRAWGLCSSLWFPPLRLWPLRRGRSSAGVPTLTWADNPWFDVRRHAPYP